MDTEKIKKLVGKLLTCVFFIGAVYCYMSEITVSATVGFVNINQTEKGESIRQTGVKFGGRRAGKFPCLFWFCRG